MMRLRICRLLLIILLTAVAFYTVQGAPSQPAQPAAPAKFMAKVRYRINSPRDQHVVQYDALIAFLKKLKFEFVPPLEDHPPTDREDRGKNVITGLIAPSNAVKLLQNSSVETVLLVPDNFKGPDVDAGRVLVRLELAGGYATTQQLTLANQVRVLLAEQGFEELTGYDHRGYFGRPHTRLLGTAPAAQLDTLIKDLRSQPSGWLGPRLAQADLPPPLRRESPLRIIEVLPDAELVKVMPEPEPKEAAALDKLSPDLLAIVNQKGEESRLVRLELFLSVTPKADDSSWRTVLSQGAPGMVIEARSGSTVTALVRAGQVRGLAELPFVSALRLARSGVQVVEPDVPLAGDRDKALMASGAKALHDRGKKGQGVRLAILDSDFQGWEALVKAKQLPSRTRYLDLTSQRNASLLPEPLPTDSKQLGHGLHCARAAALAAPNADLILIRIDPTVPHMLLEVAESIAGEPLRSPQLEKRRDELLTGAASLKNRRAVLLRERRAVLDNFEDELDLEREHPLLGDVRAWIFNTREWHRLRMAEWERDNEEQRNREQRYLKLIEELKGLRGIPVVSCSLSWSDGYPLGGASALSHALDDSSLLAKTLWFQSTGNTGGQCWAGFFRDDDGNGVLEFVPPGSPLPKGRWSSEANFLAWQPFEGKGTPELPEKTRLRVSLQWREPHDPDYFFRPGEPDLYRKPLAGLRLVLLRQRDPEGKTVPADVLEVVARSPELPARLDNQPKFSTYEATLEYTVDKAGIYALRVERRLPDAWLLLPDQYTDRPRIVKLEPLTPRGIRPLGTPTLPALEPTWELWPRLLVQAADDSSRQGRPVLSDFTTAAGGVGMIADTRGALSVGPAKLDGSPQPYGPAGPPAGLLLPRPTLRAFDELGPASAGAAQAYGADLATAFAAGMAATELSAGTWPAEIRAELGRLEGGVWRLNQ